MPVLAGWHCAPGRLHTLVEQDHPRGRHHMPKGLRAVWLPRGLQQPRPCVLDTLCQCFRCKLPSLISCTCKLSCLPIPVRGLPTLRHFSFILC